METLRRREANETAKLLRRLRSLPVNEQHNAERVARLAALELERRHHNVSFTKS